MKPRIRPVEEPTDEQRKLLAKTLPGPDGKPLNVFATLVREPELMKRMNALGGFFFVSGSIPPRERELVVLRTAGFCGSDYEVAQHRWIGTTVGLTDAELDAAVDPGSDHVWGSGDAELLAFTDELLATGDVSDATWDAALDGSDDRRLELLVLVGYYRLLASVLNAIGVEVDSATQTTLERGT